MVDPSDYPLETETHRQVAKVVPHKLSDLTPSGCLLAFFLVPTLFVAAVMSPLIIGKLFGIANDDLQGTLKPLSPILGPVVVLLFFVPLWIVLTKLANKAGLPLVKPEQQLNEEQPER